MTKRANARAAAMRKFTAGPARAMRISSVGRLLMLSSRATPPMG
jgi:hypothetical protein